MAKSKSIKIFKVSLMIILPFFLFRCANQMAPGGGEVDKIPPEIIEIYPAIGTTNYDDNYFEITFSEYVDKRSVQDAIFISPAIEGEIEYSWSGKSLEISFDNTLRTNTTYTVTIGTDVVDYNNKNRMADSYILVFSTGNEIDKGIITGTVYDKEPAGVMVFAYKKSDSLFNPAKVKPDYISQVGEKGNYKLMGLSDGEFRVIAVRDEYRDFLYNIEQDQFGAPYTDVILSETDSVFKNLNFMLAIEDTTPPHMQSAVMTDMNHILIEFNENIDSTILSGKNFIVVDSTSGEKFLPDYFYKGQGKPNQFFLTIADSLSEENEVYLVCENLTDKYSNKTLSEATGLLISTKPDTLPVKLIKTITQFSNNVVDYESPYLRFNFDDAFPRREISNAVTVVDDKDEAYPFAVKSHDDASFTIEIAKKLKPNSKYSVKMNYGLFTDEAGNKLDSVFTYSFTTINNLEFTGISGKLIVDRDSTRTYVVLEHTEQKEKQYKKETDKNLNFDFQKIIPGKYLVWSFLDRNDNGEYDRGSINPYMPSEQFVFYPDTVNARARWPVGDVIIDFK